MNYKWNYKENDCNKLLDINGYDADSWEYMLQDIYNASIIQIDNDGNIELEFDDKKGYNIFLQDLEKIHKENIYE